MTIWVTLPDGTDVLLNVSLIEAIFMRPQSSIVMASGLRIDVSIDEAHKAARAWQEAQPVFTAIEGDEDYED